jgi:hypothetical protein
MQPPAPPQLMESGDYPSFSAGAREAAAHASAGRHPNIAALLGTFEHRTKHGRHACLVRRARMRQQLRGLSFAVCPSHLVAAVHPSIPNQHRADAFDSQTRPLTHPHETTRPKVIEPLGSSLLEASALCGGGLGVGLPLPAVKNIARQTLAALDHLHR